MTGVSSLLAIVTTPLNIIFWAGPIPTPTRCCGSEHRAAVVPRLDHAHSRHSDGAWPCDRALLPRLGTSRRPLQILSFLFLVVFIGGAIYQCALSHHFVVSILPFVILHNAIAIALGWGAAKLLRLVITTRAR